MGKVLKADATLGDSFVKQDLGSPQSVIWYTYRLRFDAASYVELNGNGSYLDALIWTDGTSILDTLGIGAPPDEWYTQYGAGGTPTSDAWLLIEHGWENGGPEQVYVDGVLTIDQVDGGGADVQYAKLGIFTPGGHPAVAYFDGVKIGTTRGAEDLFADDFEDGTLDAWTTISGDVSVIDDLFPTSFTLGPVFSVAFDDPTLEANPTWTQIG